MLSGANRDFIVEKVTAKVTIGSRAWFLTFLNATSPFMTNLPLLQAPGDLALAAVRMTTENDGRAYPGVLLQLLDTLAADPTIAPKLEPIYLEARSYAPPPAALAGNPLDASVLTQQLLFWNRRALRTKLQRMLPAAGRSILVVNGGPGAGKSYTVEMLTHLKLTNGNFTLAAVRPPLDPVAKGEAKPEALAREIVSAMGVKVGDAAPPARDGSSVNQFCDLLCQWIFDRVTTDGNVYWIVLDGFGIDGVDPWVRAFIARLATKITAGVFHGRIRLILLNYPTDDLASVQDHLEDEIVSPPTEDDLKEVVKSALTERQLPFQPSDVDQTLSLARSRVKIAQTDVQYWRQLNKALRTLLYD